MSEKAAAIADFVLLARLQTERRNHRVGGGGGGELNPFQGICLFPAAALRIAIPAPPPLLGDLSSQPSLGWCLEGGKKKGIYSRRRGRTWRRSIPLLPPDGGKEIICGLRPDTKLLLQCLQPAPLSLLDPERLQRAERRSFAGWPRRRTEGGKDAISCLGQTLKSAWQAAATPPTLRGPPGSRSPSPLERFSRVNSLLS